MLNMLTGISVGGVIAIIVVVLVLIAASTIIVFFTRYKKCPSDKVMVIYGKIGTNKDGTYRSSKCIHGGAAFIVPMIQAYAFLDLTPLSISVDLRNALSKQNIRIDVPSRFTVGISTDPSVMQNAAERLLGLKLPEIQELAKDIIFGQLRLVIATMDIEEINTNRDKFLVAISGNVETELKKIGLRLINVNMTDITDESGYIEALGKEAASRAINEAKVSVAEADKNGSIGQAQAQRDERINVSLAESEAISGENKAKADIAEAQSTLRERQAEALRRAVSSEKTQEAGALEEAYAAEQIAENARATKEKATQEADIIVKAEIEKRKLELEAEAEAEQKRRIARGEAEAMYAKMEAEARGINAILTAQADGIASMVKAANGDPNSAVQLMVADKLETLVATQVEAIKNIKIDKITVWDGGNGADGKTGTSNFLSGMLKSLPPLEEMFNMAGMTLPSLVNPGKIAETSSAKSAKAATDAVEILADVVPVAKPVKAKTAKK